MPGETSAIPHSSPEIDLLPLYHRVVTLIVVLVPFAGLIWATVLVWGRGFDWLHLGLLVGMYLATGLGITIGYHRLFAHRAFATSRIVQATLAVLGSMAVEGPLLRWVAFHRSHHQHSDRDHDPHSPHTHGAGLRNMMREFWRAHAGWLFEKYPGRLDEYVADLRAERLVRIVSRLFPLWVALGLLIPTVLAGLVTRSWSGAFLGLLWGGLVRICLVHHITWSINSVCHIWGTQPFKNRDHSRNNVIFGVLAFGKDGTTTTTRSQPRRATAAEARGVEAAVPGSTPRASGSSDIRRSNSAARLMRRRYIETIAAAKTIRRTQIVLWNGVIPKAMASGFVPVDETRLISLRNQLSAISLGA